MIEEQTLEEKKRARGRKPKGVNLLTLLLLEGNVKQKRSIFREIKNILLNIKKYLRFFEELGFTEDELVTLHNRA